MVQTERAPSEEPVWRRYSPHHELPFSMTTSAAIHIVGLAILIAAVAVVIGNPPPRPPTTGNTPVVEIGPGSGDGTTPGARSDNPLLVPGRKEAGQNPERAEPRRAVPEPIRFERPRDEGVKPPDAPSRNGSDTRVEKGVQRLDRIEQAANRHLRGGSGGGIGGKGDRGGVGDQPGSGGPASRIKNIRERRAGRWVMHFNTQNGRDYRRQLADLSAGMREKTIVAVQRPNGRFLVFRDLAQDPPVGHVEDVDRIQNIQWRDDTRESIASLARALGLSYSPERIYVFFPQPLEEKLLKLELEFGGKREEELTETHFQIVKRGGVYVPVVVGQR